MKKFMIGMTIMSSFLLLSCNKDENNINQINNAEKMNFVTATPTVEFEWERGIKEWNADKTNTYCVGSKKTCQVKIKVSIPISLLDIATFPNNKGGIFYVDNSLHLAFPQAILDDEVENQIFEDGKWLLSADYHLTDDELQAISPDAPPLIHAGEYPYFIENGLVIVRLN